MDTDKHRFLFKEETHQIIGYAMEVINTLGYGLLEKPCPVIFICVNLCLSVVECPIYLKCNVITVCYSL